MGSEMKGAGLHLALRSDEITSSFNAENDPDLFTKPHSCRWRDGISSPKPSAPDLLIYNEMGKEYCPEAAHLK